MASISTEKSQPSLDANHPPPSYNFPKRPFGKKNVYRSCCAEWFASWTWLHYVEDKDAVLSRLHESSERREDAKRKYGTSVCKLIMIRYLMNKMYLTY